MPPDLTRFLQLDPTLKPILSTPTTRISKRKEGPKRPSYIPRLFTPEIARLWVEEKKNKKKKPRSASTNQNDNADTDLTQSLSSTTASSSTTSSSSLSPYTSTSSSSSSTSLHTHRLSRGIVGSHSASSLSLRPH